MGDFVYCISQLTYPYDNAKVELGSNKLVGGFGTLGSPSKPRHFSTL